ncbi:MAG: beta strand repeat-containing protein [bacterium]
MTELGKYVSNGAATLPGYPNPSYFLGNFSTDPTNTSPGQWWYNTTTGQIKANVNGTITVISTTTPIKTDANGNVLANINAQNIVPNANPTSYPSPAYYLGAVSSDPTNTSSGQWWYNTTTMQIKQNVNGTIQILGAFAGSFSSTTYIINNTTIGGSGITVNYINLVITNNATLTIAAGSNVNVAGALNIAAGSSLVMQGATLNIYNALQNAGTLQSTSSSDSIQAVQVQNTGSMQINGTLYLPSAGYNHILAGSISGTGTLNIQGTAIILIGDILELSIPTVTGSGTYQIQQNGVCTINGNTIFSIPIVSGAGTLSVASGYTLTLSNCNVSVTNLGNGSVITTASSTTNTIQGVSIPAGYTLTVYNTQTITTDPAKNIFIPSGQTVTVGASFTTSSSDALWTGTGTLSVASGYTLTIGANATFSVPTISGAGTLSVASGYTLTQGAAMTISVSSISVAGTWANAGYGITIPSGATVSWNVSGSITTASTAGTLTVNGTCYWIGSSITNTTGNGLATFTLKLAGTGIFIGAPAGTGTATATITLSAAVINANSNDGSKSGSGGIPYYSFSSQAIQGSAVGKYTIGTYDSNNTTYQSFVLIYIGTANTNYTVSGNFGYTSADKSGDTIYAWNMSGSAGTITLTGTLYV